VEEIRQFDLLNCPLEGTNLIEASAGTGKTYAICGLFVRLVLEKRLSVDRILVVTFTEAATAELKERIRVRLRDAIAGFSQGTTGKDEFIDALVEKHKGQPDAEELLKGISDPFRKLQRLEPVRCVAEICPEALKARLSDKLRQQPHNPPCHYLRGKPAIIAEVRPDLLEYFVHKGIWKRKPAICAYPVPPGKRKRHPPLHPVALDNDDFLVKG
jgi:hypothetical protein